MIIVYPMEPRGSPDLLKNTHIDNCFCKSALNFYPEIKSLIIENKTKQVSI